MSERDPSSHGTFRVYALVALGLLAIVGTLGGIKYAQIATLMAAGKKAKAAGPPPEAVATALVTAQRWPVTVDAVGTVASLRSVEIRTELPGIVRGIRFNSGQLVKQGDVLVELDTAQERSQLASARSKRDLAITNAMRARMLARTNAIAIQDVDNAESALASAQADVDALQAQIEKKVVRAPFAGRLGIRGVSLGQYVDPSIRITVLDALGEDFVDFSVPQEDLATIQVGLPVLVSLQQQAVPPLQGALVAVAPTVDAVTRNAELRARVPDVAETLKPGMFTSVSVVLPVTQEVLAVPGTAILHAPYGESVYVVTDHPPGAPGMATTPDGQPVRMAQQQFVRVGRAQGDFVAVEAGLQAGQEVVTAGGFKLRNGAPVVVNNSQQPQPQLQPRPENR